MKNKIILSTDTMLGYGLDMIFDMAKKCGYDGIDLAISKGFDAWNENYVKSLVKKYELPVYSVQTSSLLNSKEMNKVLDLCEATDCDAVTINAPKFFDFKSYSFISQNIKIRIQLCIFLLSILKIRMCSLCRFLPIALVM